MALGHEMEMRMSVKPWNKTYDSRHAPQVVAGVHNPWVTTDTSFKEFEQMRVSMEPIMFQYGVDVMFNGHVHSYERTNPVYNYALNPCGMVHIVVGDAGNSEGPSGLNYFTGTLDHRAPPWLIHTAAEIKRRSKR